MSFRHFIFFMMVICYSAGCHKTDQTHHKTGSTSEADSGRPFEAQQPDATADSLGPAGAVAVIRRYYDAINQGHYRRAFLLWENDGSASGQTLEAFRKGYSGTRSVIATIGTPGRIEGAAGSRYIDIPIFLKATTRTGETQYFTGKYVLRRVVVDGATHEQRRWHIYSASISQKQPPSPDKE